MCNEYFFRDVKKQNGDENIDSIDWPIFFLIKTTRNCLIKINHTLQWKEANTCVDINFLMFKLNYNTRLEIYRMMKRKKKMYFFYLLLKKSIFWTNAAKQNALKILNKKVSPFWSPCQRFVLIMAVQLNFKKCVAEIRHVWNVSVLLPSFSLALLKPIFSLQIEKRHKLILNLISTFQITRHVFWILHKGKNLPFSP